MQKKGIELAPRSKGQMILKLQVSVDGTGDRPCSYPEVLLYADAEWWQFMAEYCAWRARRAGTFPVEVDEMSCDPEDHHHLERWADRTLSDKIGVRLGTLTPANREVVFGRYDMSPATAFRESLVIWSDQLKQRAMRAEADAEPYI